MFQVLYEVGLVGSGFRMSHLSISPRIVYNSVSQSLTPNVLLRMVHLNQAPLEVLVTSKVVIERPDAMQQTAARALGWARGHFQAHENYALEICLPILPLLFVAS